MNCRICREKIVDMVVGEPVENAAAARSHVTECADCRRAFEETERLMAMAAQALDVEAPPLESARLRLRHAEPGGRRGRVPAWATAAGVFVGALSGAWLGYMGARSSGAGAEESVVRVAEVRGDFWMTRADVVERLRSLSQQGPARQAGRVADGEAAGEFRQ